MNPIRYIIQNLKYHRKKHVTMLLGTILSTAVLTGGLIVGDSVKYSLQQLVSKRLGSIEYVMETGDRWVTDTLVSKMAQKLDVAVVGVLKAEGIAIANETESKLNAIQILGVDSTFGSLSNASFPSFTDNEILISENVGQRLQVSAGDELLLRIEQMSMVPVNSAFAQEENPSIAFRASIKDVLSDDRFARFNLRSDQKAPYNIWVNKDLLARKMGLSGKINTVLIAETQASAIEVSEILTESWSIADAALKLSENEDHFEFISDRVFIDYPLVDQIARSQNINGSLSYLVNAVSKNTAQTPYSFVSGANNQLLGFELQANEIVLNKWCALDLDAQIGDTIQLDYFVVGSFRNLISETKNFVVKKIIENQQYPFVPEFTPDFPGLSDAQNCSEWETGVPIDLELIRDKDEDYWDLYQGTPKAIINIATAQQIWGNQFGEFTALRVNKNKDRETLLAEIEKQLDPGSLGLGFRNVKDSGISATENAVDFGELFLSLSFFVIAAGVLLLILLYSLQIVARQSEVGVLSALGFTKNKILRLFLYEAAVTIVLGSVLGVLLGVFYNKILIYGLNSIWQDAVRTNALEILIKTQSLAVGFLSGFIVSFTSVFFVIRKQVRIQIVQTLKKVHPIPLHLRQSKLFAFATFAIFLLVMAYALATNQLQNTRLFLLAGAVLIIAMLGFINSYLKNKWLHSDTNFLSLSQLSIRNLSRQRKRSSMAIALLALGTFSVIITGANRKTFSNAAENPKSGTGGFLYWAETSVPLIHDLNTTSGQEKYNLLGEPVLDSIEFIQLLTIAGDDASCLNLNQVEQPQILGIPSGKFHKRGAFSFTNLLDGIDEKAAWLALEEKYSQNTIPAYIDQTVITWGLMKKIGDTLRYLDESGQEVNIIIAGGLNSSIFQGNILIAESHLHQFFPNTAGSKIMLVGGSEDNKRSIAELLGFYFQDFGIDYELTSKRLDRFNSVTNTYLNVFMLLGGLGIIIGTIGFGIILLRNKLERKSEFALLKAMGFKDRQLFRLLFFEHLFLLLAGLIIGIAGAIVGTLPSLFSEAFSIPILFIGLLVFGIFLNGLFWIWISGQTKETNLIAALRSE